jgi:hypothetical protein
MNLSKRDMVLIGVAALIALVLIVFISRRINTDWWSGAGQWVGGLGAFTAAFVALSISREEGKVRKQDQHAHQLAQAHFITVEASNFTISISNYGTEPVTNIVTGNLLGPRDNADSGANHSDPQIKDFLLPEKPWKLELIDFNDQQRDKIRVDLINQQRCRLEIEYTTLGGQRWKRLGDDSPIPVERGY